ncbi:HNH endonuclease signature motif containing protein [Nocardioides sp. AX2bis]|uniref:HNH endonuclease signature motif containing protein n=1 Tax=Nocardioides sp. AX2bis TaxID=2653157 RepID=UPI0012F23036|nr:HNH endonuclease signature motif containing protein [Nocardioides sp. AX2bis]VXB31660.1 hypothetical protein NOCARDAX2BIS_210022 [Nocardioides sp. AX2bis]
MATTEDTTTGHPVPCGVRALAASVTALAERPLFALDAATTRDTIQALAVLESKVTSLKLAVFAHADEVQVGCEARIIPVVLGGNGEVLHQGKARRKYTAAQTYAMHARDKSCTAKGCDWPPGLCHAHHDTMFSKGGKTDIEDGRLLCPHHHARAHDPAYDMTIHADNKVTFHRRT